MTTDTLTFNFGSTPAEVIRERALDLRERMLRDESLETANWEFAYAMGTDDLLTVLAALTRMAILSDRRIERDKAYRLRIDILDALGINEGGAE